MEKNKKNIIMKVLLMFTILLSLSFNTFAIGGAGTIANPYIINTCPELSSLSTTLSNLNYKLNNSIDCSLVTWTPLVNFYSTLDGNGYTISNLNNRLINNLQGNGIVKNLKIDNAHSTGYGNYYGIAVGRNYGLIDNVQITNSSLQAQTQSGIMVGRNEISGKIYHSSVKSSSIVTNTASSDYIGGFVGYQLTGGIIRESSYEGTSLITGRNYIGGFIGMNIGQIWDSYSKTDTTGTNYIGNFVGYNNGGNAIIHNSYSIGSATGTSNVHSFVGFNNGYIYTSFYDKQIGADSTNYGATGLLTTETKDIKQFSGWTNWDFKSIWYHDLNVNNGTMSLRVKDNILWNTITLLGTGTILDPYQVTTCSQIYDISKNPNIRNSNFKIMNNIDCNNLPMKTIDGVIGGTWFGNNKLINNTFVELFANLGVNSNVYNLSINGNLKHTQIYQGLLAGLNYGKVNNVKTSGSIISSSTQVGGIIGQNGNLGQVRDSSSTTQIQALTYVGGLVGYLNSGGSIYTSYTNSTNIIIGTDYVGGLVGYSNIGLIHESYSLSNTQGNNYIGGFIGMNIGQIYNSYAKSTSTGLTSIGGFVGYNNGGNAIIHNSYSTGSASGNSNIHGFVGFNNGYIYDSIYNLQTSGDTSNYGAVGKTTTQMTNIATYSGYNNWDLTNIWVLNPSLNQGYLSLRSIVGNTLTIPVMNGTGISTDPYQITVCEQLYTIDQNLNIQNSYFKLMNNISCANKIQVPIGGTFNGDFNGNGFTILDTKVSLFNIIGSTGNVHDLKIQNAILSDTVSVVGILTKYNDGIIRNVFTNGVISSTGNDIGGLVGQNRGTGKIYNSYSFADIIGSLQTSNYVGGLVGRQLANGYIYESYSFNNLIQGLSQIGGLVGQNGGFIYDSYSQSPSISGISYVGGLVGYQPNGHIYNSYSTGSPSGTSNVGGLIGYTNINYVYNSFYDITTSGTTISSGAGGKGKYDTLMKTIQTFSGSNNWDFTNKWYMNNVSGFPQLRNIDNVFTSVSTMIGDGSPLNPFQITDCRQINLIPNSLTSNYILMNNLFCDNKEMHTVSGTFSGTFEGNNKIISGTYVPLFNIISGNVKNLGITNHKNSEDYSYYGVLAKYNDGGLIQNVYTSGIITTTLDYIGGLVGRNNANGVIEDSESYVNIYGSSTLSDYIGGLVGYNQGNGYIWRSSAKGNIITGHSYLGGLIGFLQKGQVHDSYAKDFQITGYSNIGGLIGYYYTHISYQSWLYQVYASGTLSASSGLNVGGLIGYDYVQSWAYGNFINSYFDINTTGKTTGGTIHNVGTGLTTTQMKNQTSFVGFNFTTLWNMDTIGNNGYPNQQSVIPLVITPFQTFINYPLNNENITINSSITPITLQYVHNSNSTNIMCKQYLDGVLIDTKFNVGQNVQSLTLNRWLNKQYLYEVKCSDSIYTSTIQHLFNVNVNVNLLGYNPNSNSTIIINQNGGGQSANINITQILNAINSLNISVITPAQNNTGGGNIVNNVVNNGTDTTKIYHSYYTGSQYLNKQAKSVLKDININATPIVDTRTNQTVNTTDKVVIDVTSMYSTLTLQNGTTFENIRPSRLYDNILSKPVLTSGNLNVSPNSVLGNIADNYFPNWVLVSLITGLVTFGLSGMQFGRKQEKLKRFKMKSFYVVTLSTILVWVVYLVKGLLIQ